jgi:preprotein translocase subunit SecA
VSFEDDLMKRFAPDWLPNMMSRLGLDDDTPIESKMVTRAIEQAQQRVESHNFDIRKNLLDFDDVSNDQRKVIYQQRNELLESESVQEAIEAIRQDVVIDLARKYVPENSIDAQWDVEGLERAMQDEFGIELGLAKVIEDSNHEIDDAGVTQHVLDTAAKHFADKETQVSPEIMRQLEKHLMLTVLDQSWKEHLARMDYLRQGIHLRGYAQKQPKQEYKRESFELFTELLDKVKREVTALLARIRIRSEDEVAELEAQDRLRMEAQAGRMQFEHADMGGYGADEEAAEAEAALGGGLLTPVRANQKVGRNDPCPCGSGKKYKQCHGQLV